MPLYSVYLEPHENLCLSITIEAKTFQEAIDRGNALNVKGKILAKGVEHIDGGFTVSGVHEQD